MVGGFSPVMLYFKGYCSCGRVAQLGERGVRNAEVEGSNPFASTKILHRLLLTCIIQGCERGGLVRSLTQ